MNKQDYIIKLQNISNRKFIDFVIRHVNHSYRKKYDQ